MIVTSPGIFDSNPLLCQDGSGDTDDCHFCDYLSTSCHCFHYLPLGMFRTEGAGIGDEMEVPFEVTHTGHMQSDYINPAPHSGPSRVPGAEIIILECDCLTMPGRLIRMDGPKPKCNGLGLKAKAVTLNLVDIFLAWPR